MLARCGHPVARPAPPEDTDPELEAREPGDRDEYDARDVHTLIEELRAEAPDDEPDPPWPERDETDDHLLGLLARRGSVDASELCHRLELPVGQTIARLTKLELLGDVRFTAAGYVATRAAPG
jgi:predicted Rossmann fold nucleotide-binding protein DprA/Smf involved in DNA uptake